jgi:hypothetical protein
MNYQLHDKLLSRAHTIDNNEPVPRAGGTQTLNMITNVLFCFQSFETTNQHQVLGRYTSFVTFVNACFSC